MDNPCIGTTTFTVTSVVKGRIKAPYWGGTTNVEPYGDHCVKLQMSQQSYIKSDLRYLIDRLTEIHGVL